MKYFGNGLSEKHKELSKIIRKKDRLADAVNLFLVDYFTGDNLVLINKSATARDEQAQLMIQEPIGEVMAAVMEGMGI